MIPLDICRSIWSKYNGKSNSKLTSKDNDDATTSTETASQVDLDSSSQEYVNAEAMEILVHYQSMLDLKNTVEQHRMGLECLCQHTDSTVTDVTKSKAVIQAIVCGPLSKRSNERIDDPYDIVVEKFRSSLLHFLTKDGTPEVTPVLATAGCAPKNLQCLAFRALYTSLNTFVSTSTTDSDPPKTAVFIEIDNFWYTVLQTCRRGIATSNTAPCFATMSIVLISTLLSSAIVTQPSKDVIYDLLFPNNDSSSICDELKSAHSWGQQHHTYLEEKSQQLLDLITSKNEVRL
jgi:hypothetical protein